MGIQGDQSGSSSFWGRINQSIKRENWHADEVQLHFVQPPDYAAKNPLSDFFFLRMLYSCLVDADFLDTERFMDGARFHAEPNMEKLRAALELYIDRWKSPQSVLNKQREKIHTACREAGSREKPGLFTLTVPTGGGKTIASLAFALQHAATFGKKRIIYVIPYTSIIDQTVEVFSDILGEENVLAHHSGVQYDTGDYATELSIRKAKATENWDMPVVVTTAVQFFESLYANRSSHCRKLHNLVDSVIIFDEAQMLPLPYLEPCVHAIAELVAHYGVSAVLCTATQPALSQVFQKYLPGEKILEICPQEVAQHPVFQRVTYKMAGNMSWDEVCEALQVREQVLCIVNSRKRANLVYQNICGPGAYHLSTLMCPFHRREKLKEIRLRLRNGQTCRVVSTSLIEAGVDVDFPEVFREMTGMDSIVQSAGRCNREGKRTQAESVVTVFDPETPAPPLFATGIATAKMALKSCRDFEEAVDWYFRELMDLQGEDALDRKKILKKIGRGTFPFCSVADDFQLINTPTKTIYIPYGEGEHLIEELLKGNTSREFFRKLSQYAVAVYPDHFQSLYDTGNTSLIDEYTAVLTNQDLYSLDTGLSLELDEGQALFI